MTRNLPAPADLARARLLERLSDADRVRAGRRLAQERRTKRRRLAASSLSRLAMAAPTRTVSTDVGARER